MIIQGPGVRVKGPEGTEQREQRALQVASFKLRVASYKVQVAGYKVQSFIRINV